MANRWCKECFPRWSVGSKSLHGAAKEIWEQSPARQCLQATKSTLKQAPREWYDDNGKIERESILRGSVKNQYYLSLKTSRTFHTISLSF